MSINVPLDISAEELANYLHKHINELTFDGSHKRNAYQDILDIEANDSGDYKISVGRDSIYDILPEALFHKIDRFENIAANEYKERFAEECERMQQEEENARRFFAPFDKFIFDLSCIIADTKSKKYSDNDVLKDIICDNLEKKYHDNRFIAKALQYTPLCAKMRGDKASISLMLRKILFDEGILIDERILTLEHDDSAPRYNSRLGDEKEGSSELYLGSVYDDDVLTYTVRYWNDEECDSEFLDFVEQINTFVDFINDYFMGIESRLIINISTDSLPVRISDNAYYNYLNYNTNI